MIDLTFHRLFRYHRILKRQKRKQLIKEFDDLMTRDPEAAREKLELLERDRVTVSSIALVAMYV